MPLSQAKYNQLTQDIDVVEIAFRSAFDAALAKKQEIEAHISKVALKAAGYVNKTVTNEEYEQLRNEVAQLSTYKENWGKELANIKAAAPKFGFQLKANELRRIETELEPLRQDAAGNEITILNKRIIAIRDKFISVVKIIKEEKGLDVEKDFSNANLCFLKIQKPAPKDSYAGAIHALPYQTVTKQPTDAPQQLQNTRRFV